MKRLKRIELKDILEVEQMLRDFWKTQLQSPSDNDILEDIRRMLDPTCISFLIMEDTLITGFIFVNEKYGYFNNIEYLFVKEEYRGRGLAKFALKEIKDIVGKLNNGRIQIEVSPFNTRSLKLYHSLGFDHIDTLTLSTKLDGKVEEMELFNLKFKVNPESEFDQK